MGELQKASMSGCLKQGGSLEARPCTKIRNAAQIFRPFRCICAKPGLTKVTAPAFPEL
jgi:hypothetical protein